MTTTCALLGDLLGSAITSLSSLSTSSLMNLKSSLLYRREFVAIGRMFSVRLAKGSGGSILRVLKPKTDSGGWVPPHWKVTLLCCDWKSALSIRSAQSPSRMDRRRFLVFKVSFIGTSQVITCDVD